MEISQDITVESSDNNELLAYTIDMDYLYLMSINQEDNDWNDPLNDHWDNY
jgi:hypothetical protein